MEKESKIRVVAPSKHDEGSGFGDSPFDWSGGNRFLQAPSKLFDDGLEKESAKPKDDNTLGWHPQTAPLPYLHATTNAQELEAGLGLMNYQFDSGAKVKVAGADLSVKADDPQNPYNFGVKGDAALFNAYSGEKNMVGIGATMLGASFEDSFDSETGFNFGADATIAGMNAHLGNFSSKNNADCRLGINAGFGIGAGVRGYWGDSDGDGHREYGFGLDLPIFPLGFDIQTEDPLALLSPMAGALAAKSGMNMTDEAKKDAARAGKWVSEKSRMISNSAVSTGKGLVKSGTQTAQNLYAGGKKVVNTGLETASNLGKSVFTNARKIPNAVLNGGKQMLNTGANLADGIYSGAKNTISTGANMAQNAGNWVVDKAKGLPGSAMNTLNGAASHIASSAKDIYAYGQQLFGFGPESANKQSTKPGSPKKTR